MITRGNFRKRMPKDRPLRLAAEIDVHIREGRFGSPKAARSLLPMMSAIAIADGTIGFFYHARGVLRRPGGVKLLLYNIIYGPPLFAPLLFAACGVVGLLASVMRRER